MDERWDEFAGDDFVRAMRIDVFEHRLPAWLRSIAGRPLVLRRRVAGPERRGDPPRAGLLGVSQFWNDQADDEVHLFSFVSSRSAVEFPHDCETAADTDGCRWCSNGLRDERYGQLIPAFEAWCAEDASQNDDPSDAYRPIARATIGDDGAIAVDTFGALVRPWLDLPRDPAPELELRLDDRLRALIAATRDDLAATGVLGDELAQRGDPRGELIAVSERVAAGDKDPALRSQLVELEARGARAWLGPLHPHVPRAGVKFARGVPVEVGLWIPTHRPELDDDDGSADRAFARAAAATPDVDVASELPWLFGPHVRFLPGSARRIWPTLAPARSLGPLDDAALVELIACGVPFLAEAVEVRVSGPDTIAWLREARPWLPRLRALTLVDAFPLSSWLPAALAALPWLGELAGITVAIAYDVDTFAPEVRAWSAARLPVPVTVAMFDPDAERPSGWAIRLAGSDARIARAGYLRQADDTSLTAIRAAISDLHVTCVPGPYWAPP